MSDIELYWMYGSAVCADHNDGGEQLPPRAIQALANDYAGNAALCCACHPEAILALEMEIDPRVLALAKPVRVKATIEIEFDRQALIDHWADNNGSDPDYDHDTAFMLRSLGWDIDKAIGNWFGGVVKMQHPPKEVK